MRTPQQVKELRKEEVWAVERMLEFREIMGDYWKPVTRSDALRYLNQETNEARDAWMRDNRDHARNNTKRSDLREELADVVIMGSTALGTEIGWRPYSEILEVTTDLDDLCSLASSAMDMHRWRELWVNESRDLWWLIDTEKTMMGAIAALGGDFRHQFVSKLNHLVNKHVPISDRENIIDRLPWLLLEPSNA